MADQGQIITFYSYKGGVGRSFLLASIAVTMARWGKRVVCLDWDLEAPGLGLYFRPYFAKNPQRDRGGVLDLVETMRDQGPQAWTDYISHLSFPEGVELDFIHAGSGDDYSTRVQSLDWGKLFEDYDFADKLELLRQDLKSEYDYVLIDSRTGISDVSGICAVQLPDILMMILSANDQSINGTVEIASRIPAARESLSYDRLALPIIPILSRFDSREERELSLEWQGRIANRLEPLYIPWLPDSVGVRDVLELTTIPYISAWGFGEPIPVLEERSTSPESISWAIETVSAVLLNGISDVASLVTDRDSFVRRARTRPPVVYDIFVSYNAEAEPEARDLIRSLTRDHFLVADGYAETKEGGLKADKLQEPTGASVDLVLLVSGELSRRQESDLGTFLAETVRRRVGGRIVVIAVRGIAQVPKVLSAHALLQWSDAKNTAAEIERVLSLRGNRSIDHWEALSAERGRLLGTEDISTISADAHLASAHEEIGRFDEAIPLLERALEGQERVLGAGHPDTLASRGSLARAYQAVGRVSDAIPLLERTLTDSEQVFGQADPDTLISLSNLASAYEEIGRFDEAIPLLERALEGQERVLGAGHPDTLASRGSLARAYQAVGRVSDAIPLLVRNLELSERILGSDHPESLASRNNLAVAYRASGRPSDAVTLLERTLEDSERMLGPDHPDTLTSRNNLAMAYRASGRINDAIILHEATFSDRRRVLGLGHPDTLASGNNLAETYRAAGRLDEAISLHEENLAVADQALGRDHRMAVTIRKNLEEAYRAADRRG